MAVYRQPVVAQILKDVLRLGYAASLATVAIVTYGLPAPTIPVGLDIAGRIVSALAGLLATIVLLREVTPKAVEGAHLVRMTGPYLRWLASSALSEIIVHPIVRFPFWGLHFTRVLYLKAIGADVAWTATCDGDVRIQDPSLFSIGPGAQIESRVTVLAGLHGAGRVRVGRVTLQPGCLVGAHSVLMPGVTVGHDARLEPGACVQEGVRIGVGALVGSGARIERHADLGSYVWVGASAVIGERVRIGDRARVLPGALVEPGTTISERETWAGVPARPVENSEDWDVSNVVMTPRESSLSSVSRTAQQADIETADIKRTRPPSRSS